MNSSLITATPSAPAAITAGAFSKPIPAMPQAGSPGSARPHAREQPRQPLGPERRIAGVFARGGVDRATAGVVGYAQRQPVGLVRRGGA